jgi:aryl-alcohol dehydrogenase-like predicted oxidoreductase
VPIPGTKRRKYLEENATAAEIQLTPEEIQQLEAAVPQDQIAGARYTEAGLNMVDKSA